MGYRVQLFLDKQKDVIFLGEGNNSIPYFWSAIFADNLFAIDDSEEIHSPLLSIKQPIKTAETTIAQFNEKLNKCFTEFEFLINQHISNGYTLTFDLSDILLMERSTEELQKIDMRKHCIEVFNKNNAAFIDVLNSGRKPYVNECLGFHLQNEMNFAEYDCFDVDEVNIDKKNPYHFKLFISLASSALMLIVCLVLSVGAIMMAFIEKDLKIAIGNLLFVAGMIYAYNNLRKALRKLRK